MPEQATIQQEGIEVDSISDKKRRHLFRSLMARGAIIKIEGECFNIYDHVNGNHFMKLYSDLKGSWKVSIVDEKFLKIYRRT